MLSRRLPNTETETFLLKGFHKLSGLLPNTETETFLLKGLS